MLASKAGWALSRGQIPRRSALQQKSALRQNLWGGTLRCAPVPAYEALRTGTARQILALVRKASGQGALEEVVPFARRCAAAERWGRPRPQMASQPQGQAVHGWLVSPGVHTPQFNRCGVLAASATRAAAFSG